MMQAKQKTEIKFNEILLDKSPRQKIQIYSESLFLEIQIELKGEDARKDFRKRRNQVKLCILITIPGGSFLLIFFANVSLKDFSSFCFN